MPTTLERLLGLGGAAANYAVGAEGISDAKAIGQRGYDLSQQLSTDIGQGMQFQPFTVTTAGGGVQTTPQGGYTSTLSPEMEAARQQLMTGGLGMINTATQPLAQRQQSLYDTMAQMRAPEAERARMEMEQRMMAQGRSGVRTNQFGGTPEQLAMEKALAEQSSQDSLMARQQAVGEQAQLANLGTGLFNASFTPQNELFNALSQATPLANIASTNQRQAGQYQTALGQTGINSLLQGQTVASNLQQQQLQGMTQALFGNPQQQAQNDMLAQILQAQFPGEEFDFSSGAGGLLSTLFGGGSSSNPSLIPGDWNPATGNFNPL